MFKFRNQKKFDYSVMIHGDGQYSPRYIPKLMSFFANNNVHSIAAVTGSRLFNGLEVLEGQYAIL